MGRRLLQVLAAGGALAEPVFERGGAEQAACGAGEDQREIGGCEGGGDEGEAGEEMRGGAVLAQRVGEIPAVGDEGAEEAEDLADTRGHGPIGIGLEGFGRCGGCVEHEHNKNTKCGRCQGQFSWEAFLGVCRRGIAALEVAAAEPDFGGIGWGPTHRPASATERDCTPQYERLRALV